MLSDLILIGSGLVLLVTSALVLTGSHTAEVSTRSVAALLFLAAGVWCLRRALIEPQPPLGDLALPLGVSVWLVGALWRRRGQPMRRASDLADSGRRESLAPRVERSSWLPPQG